VTAVAAVRPLAVTAHGVVSPAGFGLSRLAELLRTGEAGNSRSTVDDPADFPLRPLRLVPEFRLADHIGRKGIRHLDRMTAFGLVASKLALEGLPEPADPDRSDTGVVLGTSTGSIRSVSGLARDTITADKPYQVNPSEFPNTVMNSCAGHLAIRHSLRGVNSTVAGGHLSCLHAVRYARTAIRLGRASRLLVGGVEELSPQFAWAWHRSRSLLPQAVLGEGCALFVVEDAATGGPPPLAELLGCEVGFAGAPAERRLGTAAALARCVERALARSGVPAEEVRVAVTGGGHQMGLGHAERRGIERALGRPPALLPTGQALGDSYSASGAMQLAALLAHWQDPGTGTPGEIGLITSVGRDGHAGCLVVRRGERNG
jgi:3-oxoacyl-[acyl-carrier-protein] synthase II